MQNEIKLYGLTHRVTPEHPSGSDIPEMLYACPWTFKGMLSVLDRCVEDNFTPLYYIAINDDLSVIKIDI